MTDLPALLGGPPVRPQGLPSWPPDDPAVHEVLAAVARDGSWGRYHGPHCELLKESLRQFHGVEHVVLTSSGTAAVELALRGLGIGPESEVILAAYEFKANFTNIALLGGLPVLVDINPETGQLDEHHLESSLSDRTRAILVSHLHGGCVNMPMVMDFARQKGLFVLEDACQMPGANVHGKRAGTWGDVGVVSFGGSKTLSAGRGGAVFTGNASISQRIQLYNQRGNEAYPLSEIQAALLSPQLAQLDRRCGTRALAAEQLRRRLEKLNSCLKPFTPPAGCQLDYYKLGFWYDSMAIGGLDRDRFCLAMRAEGIPLDPGFRSLHRIHARKRFRAAGDLPQASLLDQQIVVLHHPLLLCGEEAAEEFLNALDKILRHATLLRQLPSDSADGSLS